MNLKFNVLLTPLVILKVEVVGAIVPKAQLSPVDTPESSAVTTTCKQAVSKVVGKLTLALAVLLDTEVRPH